MYSMYMGNHILLLKGRDDMTRAEENARRLVGVLDRYADDDRAIQVLAKVLNYYGPQLRQDIRDLYKVMKLGGEDDASTS